MKLAYGLAVWAVLCSAAAAQDPAPTEPPPATPVAVESPQVAEAGAIDTPAGGQLIPAGYIIDIELTEPVSSATHKRGDKFAIRLAYPIYTDAGIVVPAGVPGVGEVVSAAPPGRMGKGGELLLAARYLEFNGEKIPLRSFKFGASGKDYTAALVTAALLAPLPAALLLSFAVKGSDQTFPAGTPANAKISAEMTLPVVAPLPATPATDAPTQ